MSGIDYRTLRGQVRLGQVLELLGFVATEQRGAQVRGPCPVHGSRRQRSRSFAAHLEWHCWHYFRCGAGGNALDLWVAATKLPVYEAALALCERLRLEVPRLPAGRQSAARSPPGG
jgi:DNA primase